MTEYQDVDGAAGGGASLRSRRGLLAGAAGALGVAMVESVRDAKPALAANGNSVAAGSATTAEARTAVVYDGSAGFGGVVLLGNDSTYSGNSAAYPAGLGGWAGAGASAGAGGVANGVYGFTDNGAGNGVVGVNSNGVSGDGSGVLGTANSIAGAGVKGTNSLGTAVAGTSAGTGGSLAAVLGLISSTSPGGFSSAVRGQNNGTGGLGIGVWGSQAGSGWGMYATSASGIGLNASGGTGVGVEASGATGVSAFGDNVGVAAQGATVGVSGTSSSGTGVLGQATSASGVGVKASNSGSGGLALKATGTSDFVGVTRFSRSGHVTISTGRRTVTVKGVALSTRSLVLATAQNNVGVLVQAAVPNIHNHSIQITLNKAVPKGKKAKIGWFVAN